MYLVQELDQYISGYWDGGKKNRFEWIIDHTKRTRPGYAIVGSIAANHWFTVKAGATEKATLGNARRALGARCKRLGMGCTFKYRCN